MELECNGLEKFVVNGGKPLFGEVNISGAKNAAVLAAQILAVSDEALAEKLDAQRVEMAQQIAAKEARLQAELSCWAATRQNTPFE